MTMTMTMTHSEKSNICQMKAWPYRQIKKLPCTRGWLKDECQGVCEKKISA